ncbi:MAG TPA: hypothetical protein VGJ14_08965 [Sporichthyaceae bacterium]
MRRVRTVCGLGIAGLLLGGLTLTPGGTAKAAAPAADLLDAASATLSDVAELPIGVHYPLDASVGPTLAAWRQTPSGAAQLRRHSGSTPAVGTKRMWPALDQVKGVVYTKRYTLRGVGKNIEVWVATGPGPDGVMGTDFPKGDCRYEVSGSTTITDAEIAALMNQYDNNILPKESKAFSVAPPRDGSKKTENDDTKGLDFSGDGNKTVTLVDNVRDPNFYDFPKNQTYVAGFFSAQFNDLTDRNVMTIDAYDWTHRTGVDPRDDQNPDICKSRPSRPRLYEGIFAHEYQHLLQHYVDPAEVNFINEGLSDYAISLTGYASTTHTVFQKKNESHIICFNGFGIVRTKYNPNPQPCGGPENSLTLWGDEGDGGEILADYGEAWSFLLFLKDRYGPKILESIHRDGQYQGLTGVQVALDKYGKHAKVADVLHDFQLMTLLDKLVSQGKVSGISRARVSTPSLNSSINLLNPAAYIKPGAAPNGADFVPLRTTGAGFLPGKALSEFGFAGAHGLPAIPLAWTEVPKTPLLPPLILPSVPNAPPPDPIVLPDLGPLPIDHPALFSGNSSNTDASAVFRVTVPSNAPRLTYTSSWSMEDGFDWGYTVISTDDGKTYRTLGNANTKPTRDPAPDGQALTGSSPIATPQTFDLAPYAGQSVILGFRYVSDPLVNAGGWYIDDVKVGDTVISDGSSIAPFKSFTEMHPVVVHNWSVALVGLDEAHHRAHVARFNGRFDLTLTKSQIKEFAGYPTLVAVISYDDPTETVQTYAPYTLTVDGVGQAGGH